MFIKIKSKLKRLKLDAIRKRIKFKFKKLKFMITKHKNKLVIIQSPDQ